VVAAPLLNNGSNSGPTPHLSFSWANCISSFTYSGSRRLMAFFYTVVTVQGHVLSHHYLPNFSHHDSIPL
jgi:hypothetical protein